MFIQINFKIIKMQSAVYLVLFSSIYLTFSISNIEAKCERQSMFEPKTYVIDLDKSPNERFKEVVTAFKEPMLKWIAAEKYSIN